MEEGLKYDYVSVFAGEDFFCLCLHINTFTRLSQPNLKENKELYWMDPGDRMQTLSAK